MTTTKIEFEELLKDNIIAGVEQSGPYIIVDLLDYMDIISTHKLLAKSKWVQKAVGNYLSPF